MLYYILSYSLPPSKLKFCHLSTAVSVGASKLRLEIATGNPHPRQREAKATTCGSHFHKLKIPHNNKLFLVFNITFFIIIFKLYMRIELSQNHEITLFLMDDKKHTDTPKIILTKMLLKTLFLSCKSIKSMTVIPALTFQSLYSVMITCLKTFAFENLHCLSYSSNRPKQTLR